MTKISIALIIILIICTNLSSQSISFNTADTSPYSTEDNNGFYDVLLSEVMKNLGYTLTINHYPSERSINWANQGHDDGEYARIYGLSETFSNLVIVEEPLLLSSFVAIQRDGYISNINNWDDLKDHRVGYLRGWKIYENNVGNGKDISVIDNLEDLFNLLKNNRLDIILYSRLRAEEYIRKNKLEGLEIINNPLSERSMHLYLNIKNSDLITDINKEINKFKGNGRYDEIYEEYLRN